MKKASKGKAAPKQGLAHNAETLRTSVLTALRESDRPLQADDFLPILGLARKHVKQVISVLEEFEESGLLLRLHGRVFTLVEGLRQVTGKLSIQRGGMGFILPEGKDFLKNSGENKGGKQDSRGEKRGAAASKDVYVHQSNMGGAWAGDRVRAVIFPDRRGKNAEGRILEVLERGLKELPARVLHKPSLTDYGTAEAGGSDGTRLALEWIAQPLDSRLPFLLLVDVSSLSAPVQKGEILLVNTTLPQPSASEQERGGRFSLVRGAAILNFGSGDSLMLHERLVKALHDIPVEFPEDVLQEAALLPHDPAPEDLEAELGLGRRDLRALPFVTIDGADAKDFDDAVYVRALPEGSYSLWVAIADVSHYVRPGSALDGEALRRGNSYYFPASVEPMLPEVLSNGLCSLREGVNRQVMVAEIRFSMHGVPQEAAFYPAVISSHGRLTYEEVEAALKEGAPKGGTPASGKPAGVELSASPNKAAVHLPMLTEAAALARLCISRRAEAGNLDFELPEAAIQADASGQIIALGHRERLFAHRLIEAFMVAANEAVALHLREHERSLLYRVHPAPDPEKVAALLKSLRATTFGARYEAKLKLMPAEPAPKQLQRVLAAAQDSPEEFLISRLTLRSMMQARYSPEPEGHFGLASDCYCHFTSPIRRYADLTVHRSLKALLAGQPGPQFAALAEAAEEVNATERRAVEAEREIGKVCAALYLRDKIGESFMGIISGLTDFGIFVELLDMAAEGMIRLESLSPDYYLSDAARNELYGERGGQAYRLGQKMQVTLISVSVERREITFAPADNSLNSKDKAKGKYGLRQNSGASARKSPGGKNYASPAAVPATEFNKDKSGRKAVKKGRYAKGLTTGRRRSG